MPPIENHLKNINPTLILQREERITKTIFHLKEKGFEWKETKKVFYNEKIDIVISPYDFEKILEDNNFFEEVLKKDKDVIINKRSEYLGNIKAAGIIINCLVFLIIMNLFLGWIIFNIYLWVFLEIIFVFFLVSFIKIRNKIKKNVN
jgi:hypothetical protein